MNQPYNRISENVLFTALIAVAIGWMAMSAGTDAAAVPVSAAAVVATAGANHS